MLKSYVLPLIRAYDLRGSLVRRKLLRVYGVRRNIVQAFPVYLATDGIKEYYVWRQDDEYVAVELEVK